MYRTIFILLFIQTCTYVHGATLPELDENVCKTEACSQASVGIRNWLNESNDPCDNFYEFACGNLQTVPVKSSFSELSNGVFSNLNSYLSAPLDPNEPNSFRQAKIFFHSCLNQPTLNVSDGDSLFNAIMPMVHKLDKYGGWPLFKEDWKSENFNWVEAKKQMTNDGLKSNVIFDIGVMVDPKDSSKYTLVINVPSFSYHKGFLDDGIEEVKLKDYLDALTDAAIKFGANETLAREEIDSVVDLNGELAELISEGDILHLLDQNNRLTIRKLQELFPYLNWLDMINSWLNGVQTVDENEVILVVDPTFLEGLGSVLAKTSNRTLANYLACYSIIFGSFQPTIDDKPVLTSPRTCYLSTQEHLPYAMGSLYVQKFFRDESKPAAAELSTYIRDEFIEILRNASWLDDETRLKAVEKATATIFNVAYSDEHKDNDRLEEYYEGLQLQPGASFLENFLQVRVFERARMAKKLRQTVSGTVWETTSPSVINAFYQVDKNNIFIPASILQGRFFSFDKPSYLNFGSLGWIIAHEITHGFDIEGHKYDFNGNLNSWWETDTEGLYESKAECYVDQYSEFKHPVLDLKVSGGGTQSENIADNGGIKAAYAAYERYMTKNGPEKTLPDLKYSGIQLLWISAAQTWCETASSLTEGDITQQYEDSHAPNRYRVIGAFRNMHAFARDFNCNPNSKMNPENKCDLW